MIKITTTYKRHRLDEQLGLLMLQELVIEDHARTTNVCNMVSAISLYGIKALKQKNHWSIFTRSGLLIVKNIYPDNSSSVNDHAVLRTITIQLNELAKKFPREIKMQMIISDDNNGGFNSDGNSYLPDELEINEKKSDTQEKPVKDTYGRKN
jgi:uncharacterized protein YsxB (DUF464 family)